MNSNGSSAYQSDKLERQAFAQRLEHFLLIEHAFVSESLVVSLNAPFGAGKTTFLQMWIADLKKRRLEGSAVPIVLSVNAWEDDFCGEPLFSLVCGLIRAIEEAGLYEAEQVQRLREAAKDVGWFILGISNSVVSKFTGIDVLGAGDLAETRKKTRQPPRPDYLKVFEEKSASLKALKTQLKAIFGGDSPKAFIILDELDRCRPDYAIHYLETIKHVFDIHGLVFVVAMDYDQMASSARSLFGRDLCVDEYFRKFIQRSFSLPPPDAQGVASIVDFYMGIYLEVKGKRASRMNLASAKKNISDLIKATKMVPRQIQELFRMLGHVMGTIPGKSGEAFWSVSAATIFIAMLQITNRTLYHNLGRGLCTLTELGQYIQNLGLRNSKWWFCVLAAGQVDEDNPNTQEIIGALTALGYIEVGKSYELRSQFREFLDGWDYSTGKRIEQIYNAIESAESFGYTTVTAAD